MARYAYEAATSVPLIVATRFNLLTAGIVIAGTKEYAEPRLTVTPYTAFKAYIEATQGGDVLVVDEQEQEFAARPQPAADNPGLVIGGRQIGSRTADPVARAWNVIRRDSAPDSHSSRRGAIALEAGARAVELLVPVGTPLAHKINTQSGIVDMDAELLNIRKLRIQPSILQISFMHD